MKLQATVRHASGGRDMPRFVRLTVLLSFLLACACALSAQSVPTKAWIPLNASGGPQPYRNGPSFVYDPTSNRVIAFGGCIFGRFCFFLPDTQRFNDVWVLTNANGLGGTAAWMQLTVNPDPATGFPLPRLAHSAAYDVVNNRMIIWG